MTFKLYNRFITIFAQIYFFMDLILKYFPELSDVQKQQFEALQGIYEDWNSKINVISRKDIHALYLRHVLHSLALAKLGKFHPNADILDVGTGGGFPGIPLAILYPETNFYLVDYEFFHISILLPLHLIQYYNFLHLDQNQSDEQHLLNLKLV